MGRNDTKQYATCWSCFAVRDQVCDVVVRSSCPMYSCRGGAAWLVLIGPNQNWTNYVRIGAYGLGSDNAERIVQSAQEDGVFGIEVDNDIEGRYESFVNPEEKLKAIHAVAEKAHAAGNYAFVYIAGTECITANADQTPHTLYKEHPDWVQRKINGRAGDLWRRDRFLDSEGGRGCLGQSLCAGVAEDLYGAGAADCGDGD